MSENLLRRGDPFDDPLWQRAALAATAPPRPTKGHVVVPLAWLARVRSAVRSVDQLILLQLLYRRCLMNHSRTVSLPNGELDALGISRYAKYRALAWLKKAGVVAVGGKNGRAIDVTLLWFP
jgi:hypothetical protein